jgi:probable rRNA maturation factor
MSVRLVGPPRRSSLPGFDRAALRRRARLVLAALGEADSEVSIALVDDGAMAELNERWRGRSGPTDVLSFSLVEGEYAGHRRGLLGDVVIDVEQASRQADARGHGLDEEIARLLIHGTLHLLGFDHEERREAARMRRRERELWAKIRD